MNIFILRQNFEALARQFPLHFLQTPDNRSCLAAGQHTGLGERPAMSDAALDIMGIEPAVDVDGTGKRFDQPICVRSRKRPLQAFLTIEGGRP